LTGGRDTDLIILLQAFRKKKIRPDGAAVVSHAFQFPVIENIRIIFWTVPVSRCTPGFPSQIGILLGSLNLRVLHYFRDAYIGIDVNSGLPHTTLLRGNDDDPICAP